MDKSKIGWRILQYTGRAIAGVIAASIAIVVIYRFVPVYYTPLMALRSIEGFLNDKPTNTRHKWVDYESISLPMKKSVIKAEDYRFFDHSGFDFDAIEKAMKYNKTHKQRKGASTISQQTAKNVFLWPSRSWLRKGLEAYFTVLIEALWSKERILEVYLNVIELGHGVYGVEAAANKFFNKKALQLNHNEAALMAAVLPNPRRFRIDRPSPYILGRQRKIMYRASPPVVKPPPAPEEDEDSMDLKLEDET
ncbi:Penicillin-binding protein 2D [compost metagenome]